METSTTMRESAVYGAASWPSNVQQHGIRRCQQRAELKEGQQSRILYRSAMLDVITMFSTLDGLPQGVRGLADQLPASVGWPEMPDEPQPDVALTLSVRRDFLNRGASAAGNLQLSIAARLTSSRCHKSSMAAKLLCRQIQSVTVYVEICSAACCLMISPLQSCDATQPLCVQTAALGQSRV